TFLDRRCKSLHGVTDAFEVELPLARDSWQRRRFKSPHIHDMLGLSQTLAQRLESSGKILRQDRPVQLLHHFPEAAAAFIANVHDLSGAGAVDGVRASAGEAGDRETEAAGTLTATPAKRLVQRAFVIESNIVRQVNPAFLHLAWFAMVLPSAPRRGGSTSP